MFIIKHRKYKSRILTRLITRSKFDIILEKFGVYSYTNLYHVFLYLLFLERTMIWCLKCKFKGYLFLNQIYESSLYYIAPHFQRLNVKKILNMTWGLHLYGFISQDIKSSFSFDSISSRLSNKEMLLVYIPIKHDK